MTRLRWMALCFALGSTCFLVGPFPGYAAAGRRLGRRDHVLRRLDPVHGRRGAADRGSHGTGWRSAEVGGRAAWWSAIVQSAGTLFFNVTTYQAMHVALTSSDYDKLVWRPDWRRVHLLPRLRRDRLRGVAAPRTARMGAGTRR